ncbi:MAG: mechanosensitive ion channel [Gammaproteobacteria bacterium]|nr:mechanosensitive ion channel [Gammaproteobacteria bacterium]MDH5302467.1 mechanosensitive ion channel [Gammaproteobacteria bacterium]MDH5321349.1 mechanosensitive ion channel [Gammaproteobacteria bacterium]
MRMPISATRTIAAASLIWLMYCGQVFAQEIELPPPPEVPNLEALQTNWWSFFEGSRVEVEPRVTGFLTELDAGIANLAPQNEVVAQNLVVAIRDNIAAYLLLLDDPALEPLTLDPAPFEYSIDELLRLAAIARAAAENTAEERLEVERESRIFAGASRRRDTLFDDYVGAAAGDERVLAALRLMQARSAQAISARRVQLLQQRLDRADAYARATAEQLELAKTRLDATIDEAELDALAKRVEMATENAAAAAEELRAAQLAASGLEQETPDGRSQQRLLQLRLLDAEVEAAIADTVLLQSEAHLRWAQLLLGDAPGTSVLTNQMLAWSEFLRDIDRRTAAWRRETEEELLAVQRASRDDISRASRRLLDQRLGTAQETLTHTAELRTAVADLGLLTSVVELAARKQTGILGSALASAQRSLKTAYLRITSLADVTLFSIGEAPVTGGDILRVMLILVAAMLLSRGIRNIIRRFGEGESSGTQASLYTVGRLSHYVIVILAVFIALSSIGIDFGNLALVAGALSVGIGFGLQSIVNNFVSGLIILFEHSLRVGDYIELDTGLTGTVKSINVRSTLINTNDNIDIVVPNSEFVSARLTNWTLAERVLRVRVPFGVAYGSDKELVKKAALEAAAEVSYTLTNMKGREPDVWLVEFGDSSLNFLLLVWVNRQGARRPTRTKSAYLWALETKLRKYGIEIPFPQRDLHLRSGWTPAQAAGQQVVDTA